jgi:rRNA-processing protein FCF1
LGEEADRGIIKVLLDSNFLFVPLHQGIDIFEELDRLLEGRVRCVVTHSIVDELERLKRDSGPSLQKEARFAIGLTKRCDLLDEGLLPCETVDESILRVAKEQGYVVATNDAELRRRLRRNGVAVVYVRQRSQLALEGPVLSRFGSR